MLKVIQPVFSLFSLSAHQLSCFLETKLQNVYYTLHIFVQWIEDGYYDFQSLPYATKTHLHVEDERVLQQLQQDYKGTTKCACNYFMQECVVEVSAILCLISLLLGNRYSHGTAAGLGVCDSLAKPT